MPGVAKALRVVWNDAGTAQDGAPFQDDTVGIRNIFSATGRFDENGEVGGSGPYCSGCHAPNKTGLFSTGAWQAYRPCYTCHDPAFGQAPATTFPDWLVLSTPAALKRNSYYSAGFSKAQASVHRARDFTMPPYTTMHGWCDEIADKVQQWVDGGFQCSTDGAPCN